MLTMAGEALHRKQDAQAVQGMLQFHPALARQQIKVNRNQGHVESGISSTMQGLHGGPGVIQATSHT